jgi:hypothetical protein
MTVQALPFPVYDADNNLYEPGRPSRGTCRSASGASSTSSTSRDAASW